MGITLSRGRLISLAAIVAVPAVVASVIYVTADRDGGPAGWRKQLRKEAAEYHWVVDPKGRIPLPLQEEMAEVNNDLFPRERWGMAETGRIIELMRQGRREVEEAARGRRGEEEVESRIGLGLTRMLNASSAASSRFRIGAPMDADAVSAIHAELLDMARSPYVDIRRYAFGDIKRGKMFNNPSLREAIERGVHDPEPDIAAGSRAAVKAFGSEVYMKKCEEFWLRRGY